MAGVVAADLPGRLDVIGIFAAARALVELSWTDSSGGRGTGLVFCVFEVLRTMFEVCRTVHVPALSLQAISQTGCIPGDESSRFGCATFYLPMGSD